MAAPSVRGRTAPAAGGAATSPANTAIGDLVCVLTWERVPTSTVPTHTLEANFVEIFSHSHVDGTACGRLSVAYQIATSAGANSYQAYTSDNGTPNWVTGIVVLTVGTFAASATSKGLTASASVTSTNTTAPNPPDATLGNTRDWLVLAVGAWHHGSAVVISPVAPVDYANLIELAGSANLELAISDRSLTAPVSENPGIYSDNIAPQGTVGASIGFCSILDVTGAAIASGATAAVVVADAIQSVSAGAIAVSAVGAMAVVDATVTGGFTEHFTSLALVAAGDESVSASSHEVLGSVLALDGAGVTLLAGALQEASAGVLALAAAGEITISTPSVEALSGVLVVSASGSAAVGVATVSVASGGLEVSAAASAAVVEAINSIPVGVISVEATGTLIVVDATVTGGFTEHFTSLAVTATAETSVGSPLLDTTTVLAASATSTLMLAEAIASIDSGALAVSSAASIELAGASQSVIGSVIAASAAASAIVVDVVQSVASGGVTASATAEVLVAGASQSVSVSGIALAAGGVAVVAGISQLVTSGTLAVSDVGALALAGALQSIDAGGLALSAATEVVIVDATVSEPGVTEWLTGALALETSGSALIAGAVQSIASGGLAANGLSSLALSGALQTVSAGGLVVSATLEWHISIADDGAVLVSMIRLARGQPFSAELLDAVPGDAQLSEVTTTPIRLSRAFVGKASISQSPVRAKVTLFSEVAEGIPA